jgi:hypothetical protein
VEEEIVCFSPLLIHLLSKVHMHIIDDAVLMKWLYLTSESCEKNLLSSDLYTRFMHVKDAKSSYLLTVDMD